MSQKCPECGGKIVKDAAKLEAYCENCGLVIEETPIDLRKEWRAFSQEEKRKKERTGPPSNLIYPGKGLGTIGTIFVPKELIRNKKLTRSGRNKNLIFALSEIKRMSSQLNLPKDVEERAWRLYLDAKKINFTRGRKIERVVAAVLRIACRQYRIPLFIEDLEKISGIKKEKICKDVKSLQNRLKIKQQVFLSSEEHVGKIFTKLGLNDEQIKMRALEIAKKAEKEIGNENPKAIAAAAIYRAYKEIHLTQEKVAKAAEISVPTLERYYKKLPP